MSDEESAAVVEEAASYPPLLDLVVPGVMLVSSVAYAVSLRTIPNPDMNLLLLKPLFVVLWLLLALVILKSAIPAVRAHLARRRALAGTPPVPWRERLAPGTELGAMLVVAATFVYAFFGPGRGPVAYVAALFVYLLVAGYAMGDRQPLALLLRAGLCTLGIYLLMGVLLGVRL